MVSRAQCLLCAVAFLAVSCEKETPPPPIRPVRVMEVVSPEKARDRTFSGTAKASEESVLSFKVPGTITSIRVNVGDAVQEGQILATLDPLDYRLEVERTEAMLSKREADQRNANASYERARALYETRVASRADLDNARAEYEGTRASVVAAERQLALALRDLSYTQIIGQANGAIAEKIGEVNENVRANQPVLSMVAGTKPEVNVQMPENLIGYITPDYPVTAHFSALSGETLTGKVIHIGVATTGTSTTYPVTLLINDPNGDIRSGMAARITFKMPYNPNTDLVEVPSVAVGENQQGNYVYLVTDVQDGIGVIQRQPVVTGRMLDQKIVIKKGLKGGETLVIAGIEHIKPGMKVRLYTGKSF